jgi:hypothetical protein
MKKTKPTSSRINALSVAKMIKALLDGPTSIYELTDVSGLHIHTIRIYMNTLMKEKCVHISGWEKDARNCDNVRIFSLGYGKNAPRSRKPKAQVAKEVRDRKKARLLSEAFSIAKIDNMEPACNVIPFIRVPLLTEKPLTSAEIWGEPRKRGRPRKNA